MPPVGPPREAESIRSPVWGPKRLGHSVFAWNIRFDYDGEMLSADASPTPAGAQDLGLPAHTSRRRVRARDWDSYQLASAIADLSEELAEQLLADAHRLREERAQLTLDPFADAWVKPVHVRGVRRELLGGGRQERNPLPHNVRRR